MMARPSLALATIQDMVGGEASKGTCTLWVGTGIYALAFLLNFTSLSFSTSLFDP